MHNPSSDGARWWRLAGAGAVLIALTVVLAIENRGATAGGGKNDSQVKLTAKAGAIGADGMQTVTIKMQVNAGWHAYANPVQNEDFEPNKTIVQVASATKLEKVEVKYPKGQRHMTGSESYYIYEGEVEIKADVKRAAGDTGALAVTVKYVTCNDKQGICLPPETVKLEVK